MSSQDPVVLGMSEIDKKRHSLAHLLAAAVVELYPHVKTTIGPWTDTGFYYDFDFGDTPLDAEALPKIQEKMNELFPTWDTFTGKSISKDEALSQFANNEYKTELINEIAEKGEELTVYTSGSFTDLCRGGHVAHMSDIDPQSFVIHKVAGAYWRGNEKNKMLTRIYGLAFNTKAELDAYQTQMAEAEKRDHKKLGRELNLFVFSPLVGSGLPMLKPHGMVIRREIEEYLWDLHKHKGYDRVWTPHLAKEALYETSGHLAFYKDDMFFAVGAQSKEHFCIKPMSCPHHMQIFADNQYSYRDMPIRYFEPATVYRDEKTGQLAGLARVRSITQDDGHLFCRASQIEQEVTSIVSIIKEFYTTMGLMEDYWVRLSVRGKDTSQFLGSNEVWETAEKALEETCKVNNLNYKRGEGEAAFYGPKLDFIFRDSIGREWQLATIQCDFNMPERFDLSFINEEGKKERPVVIHRAISGSLERFIGIIIEHFAGNFPLWLSPVQVAVIPVGATQMDAAQQLAQELKAAGIRTRFASDDNSLGKKIRGAKTDRIPYWIVVGDKEIESGTFNLEHRTGSKVSHDRAGLLSALLDEIRTKKI